MAERAQGASTPRPPAVTAAGTAAFLITVSREMATSLLPVMFIGFAETPAAAAELLGFADGAADGAAGAARLGGAEMAEHNTRHRHAAIIGLPVAGILAGLIGAAAATWQAALLRIASQSATEFRDPAHGRILEDAAAHHSYANAEGLAAFASRLARVVGPLLALGLFAALGPKKALLLAAVPGILATVFVVAAVRRTPHRHRERRGKKLQIRAVMSGGVRPLLLGIAAFEFGNVAATLLILRAVALLKPGMGETSAVESALAMYALFNVAAIASEMAADRLHARIGPTIAVGVGVTLFLAAYFGFALTGPSIGVLTGCFVTAGLALGAVRRGEAAAVHDLVAAELRESALGVLSVVQAIGNFAAAVFTGLIWAEVGVKAAMLYLTAWMAISLVGLVISHRTHRGTRASV